MQILNLLNYKFSDTADARSNEPFESIEDDKGDITGPQKCKCKFSLNNIMRPFFKCQ